MILLDVDFIHGVDANVQIHSASERGANMLTLRRPDEAGVPQSTLSLTRCSSRGRRVRALYLINFASSKLLLVIITTIGLSI